jgi:DNA-binding response OmpR family regulator
VVRRALVVDDDVAHAASLRRHLEAHGIGAVVATTLAEAARGLGEPVDAVFVDLRLGDDDGWQLVARLRRGDAPPGPVVVVSGLGDPATRARALANHCAFVVKPYTWDELAGALRRAVVLVAQGDDAAPVPSPV